MQKGNFINGTNKQKIIAQIGWVHWLAMTNTVPMGSLTGEVN